LFYPLRIVYQLETKMGFWSKGSVARVLRETLTWEICSLVVLATAIFMDPVLSVALAKGLACLALVATLCGIYLILRLMKSLDLI